MKHLKSLLSLVLTIVFIASLAVVPAFAAGEKIVGDCKLFLPNEGGIQVAYTLKDASGNAIAEPTYAITEVVATASQTAVAAEEVYKYAQINTETGALSVSQLAKGHTITITATAAGNVEASHQVEVSNVKYFFDFEDETVGSTVSNTLFTGRTGTVIAGNGGKAAHAVDWNSDSYASRNSHQSGLYIDFADFDSSNYTIEGKMDAFPHPFSWWATYCHGRFAWLVYDDGNGTIGDEDNYFAAFVEPNDDAYTFNAGVKGTDQSASARRPDPSDYSEGQIGVGTDFYPFVLNIRNHTNFNLTLNGENNMSNTMLLSGAPMGTELSRLAFLCDIDDIEIYTGTKISEDIFAVAPQPPVEEDVETDEAGNTLKGDKKLFMPNSGIVKVDYQAVDVNGEAIEGAAYSLEGTNVADYAAIDPVTGELYIKASATGQSFKVKADAAGGIALTKTVTVNADKYFFDFEDETVGSAVTNTMFTGKTAAVVSGNGGKAVHVESSAKDSFGPANSSKSGLYIDFADFDSSNYTIEGKMDGYVINYWGYDQVNARFAWLIYDNGDGVYDGSDNYFAAFAEANDPAYTFNGGVKGTDQSASARRPAPSDYSEGQLASGTVFYPFKLTIRNHTDFSLTLNGENNMGNTMLLSGAPMGTELSRLAFLCDIDDIEIYTGTKVTETVMIGGVEVLAGALNNEIPVAAGQQTVSLSLVNTENPDASDLIIAHYNADGKLVKAERAAVTASNKIVSMTDTFAEGDYVKGFYWKWSTVQPIR